MNRIELTNPDLSKQERGVLDADASAGDTTLTLENTNGLSADDLFVIRGEGAEQTEKVQIDSVDNDTTITTTSGLKFAHNEGVKITVIPYDQIQLYSASSETGSYSEVGSWTNLEFDQFVTRINDTSGGSSTWYKARYKNSVSGQESELSDAFQASTTQYCEIREVLEEAGMLGNVYISNERVHRLQLAAESKVKGTIGRKYTLPLSEVPEIISEVTRLYAAGRLMLQEYTDAGGTDRDGQPKIDEARRILQDIQEGDVILLDSSDTELAQPDRGTIEGIPNNSTDEEAQFSIDMDF